MMSIDRRQIDRRQTRQRRGLTLMELVVVLVILIALAGILLPMLPAFLTKTHDAVTTTNITEVEKAITGFFSANLAYPNQLDALVDNASGGNMYAGLLFNANNAIQQNTFSVVGTTVASTSGGSQAIYTASLPSGQATSLYVGGINSLMLMSPSTSSPPAFNATFPNPGARGLILGLPSATTMLAIPTPSSSSSSSGSSGTLPTLLFADNNYVFQRLNIQPTLDTTGAPCNYVVLGLGPYSTIVGAHSFGMFDAPVAFGEHAYEQPISAYARYLCVFRVFSDGTRCEFVAACHDDPTGLGTYNMHLQEYYQTTN